MTIVNLARGINWMEAELARLKAEEAERELARLKAEEAERRALWFWEM